MSAAQVYGVAVSLVAKSSGLSRREVWRPQGLRARRARHLAAYLTVVGRGVPLRQVARVAGVNHYTLQRGVAAIEDWREVGRVDDTLQAMEGWLCANC